MDGSPASPLPPINSPAPAAVPFGAAGTPNGMPVSRPVGRPLGDPEADRAKVERSAELKRIESVLPKQMDSKLLIYRTKGGRFMPGSKPILKILVSELEQATKDGGFGSSDEYIVSRIVDKCGQQGSYQCRFVDKSGRPVPNLQPLDLSLDDEGDEGEEDMIDDEDDVPTYQQQPPQGYAPPPQAPPLDINVVSHALRAERSEEQRRSSDMTVMLTTMMQQNAQQQAAAQAAQQTQLLQFQQSQAEAARQARIEADAREERAEKRRAEFRQTLLASAPVLLPVITKLLGLDKDKTADPSTALLIEMVRAKAPDSDILKQTSGLMADMVRTQMQLQGAGAQAAVQMQADASSMVFKNMMSTIKELMEQQTGLKKDKEEPSMLGQIAEIAKAVLPALQQQQGDPQALPGAPGIEATPAVAAPVQQPVAVRRVKTPAPPPPAAAQPAAVTNFDKFSDAQRIASVLDTIRRMSLGIIAPAKRFEALAYCARAMPVSMKDAVGIADKEKVMTLGAPVVMGQAVLADWIKHEHNQDFLQAAMDDLTLMLRNAMTEERVKASFDANVAFLAKHGYAATVTAAPAQPAADEVHSETAEEGTIVEDTPPAEKKAEIVQGPGSAPAPRRGKIPPPPPPAAPEG